MSCNVGALGGLFDTVATSNYKVNANGRQVDPAELFSQSFLKGRTRELVEAVVNNLNRGATVTDDGSVIASNASGLTLRTAPAGSVIVSKYRMLYPKPSSAVAMGIPIATTPSTKVLAISPNPAPTVQVALNAGTPAPTSPTKAPGLDLSSVLGQVVSIGTDLYSSSQQRKAAEATAKAAVAQAQAAQYAAMSPVLAPPTGSPQGSAANYAPAVFGPGFGSGAGAPAPSLSLPALPGLPMAPGLPELPTSGLPTYPGLPATSETADGKLNLNAAALTQLMANTAAAAQPLPAPGLIDRIPWKTIAVAAVVAGGIYLATRRRRR